MNKLYKSGNGKLLTLYKTAFLCSRQVPEPSYKAVLQWVYKLSPVRDCVLCGNHSYAEQKMFTQLPYPRLNGSYPSLYLQGSY